MSIPTRFAAFLPGAICAKSAIEKRLGFARETVEGVAIAAPGRRWLASATDVLLLLAAHLLLLTPFTYFAPDQFVVLRVAFTVSPIACWAYLWWGWARGQTPGGRAWGVRVIADDGEPMTAGRAFKRVIGYAFVCLLLKIGLLPILFDPLRRGWHDRFAKTLVIDERAPAPDGAALRAAFAQARQIEDKARRARPLPAAPDFALARRGWPLILGAYLILSVALTWPVAPLWRTALAGDGGDAWVFVWNDWFFSHAIATGGPLLSTDLLFQGFQTPLLFHTMNWFDCALAWPLLRVFTPVETYNLLFLLTPALCAWGAYWLACSLTKARLASFIVAPVFGFSPYFMAHGQGHANLTSAQMLPIFAGLFYAALVCRRARYAVGAGVALALAGLCDWQYLLFGSVIAVALWMGVEASSVRAGQAFQLRRAGLALGALLCGGILLSPMLVPLVRESSTATYMNRSGQAGGFSATLRDWTRPGKFNPVLRAGKPLTPSNENDLTPGWCVLALCALGLLWRRKTAPYLWVGGVALVLAFGPYLVIGCNESLWTLAMGVPGNGLSPPWNTSVLVTLPHRFALDFSLPLFRERAVIEMPFSWLAPHVPMLKAFRVPARLAVVVLMCCVPLAATGLSRLFETLARRRRWLAPLAAVVVAALMGFEYLTYPFPTSEIKVPAFYQQIARDPRHYAVADVPVEMSQRYGGWQVVHGKATVVGIVSRCPPEAFELVARNPLLRALSTEVFQIPGHRDPTLPGPNFDYGPAIKELRAYNVRYLVMHKNRLTAGKGARIKAVASRLQLPVIFEDADTRVYQIATG